MESQSVLESGSRSPIVVGQVLLGKYRIERVIGQGGMGLVLGATHVELQHRVAIKVLLPGGMGSEKIEARFLREAQAAASIRSENVVRVFDVGRLEDNCPYMVMEWLEGRDLSTGPMGAALPVEEAVDYVVQACDAMAAAHGRQLVHRDLKPANLFLAQDEHGIPTIKVLDFGISKLKRAEEPNMALTEANGVMGSPLYMSPEQVRSARDVDVRADIWSLGTILYELLTGVPPFNGETLGAVFLAVAQEDPRPITELRPELPVQLDAIIRKCLEKDPERRYQRAQDLQQALLPFASVRSQAKISMRTSSAPPGMVLSSPPQAIAAAIPAPAHLASRTTGGWSDSASQGRQQHRRVGMIAVGVVGFGVVAASVAGWLVMARHSETREPLSMSSDVPQVATSSTHVTNLAVPASVAVSPVPTPIASAPLLASDHAQRLDPVSAKTTHLSSKRSAGSEKPATLAEPPAVPPAAQTAASPPPAAAKPPPATAKKNPLDIQFK